MMPTLVMDDRFAGLFLFSISLLVLSHSSYIPLVFLLFFVSIFPGWPSRCHCLDRLEMVKMAAGSWRWGIRTALPSSLSSYRQQVNERENVFDVSAVQGGHKVERRRNISLLRQPCRERERERDETRKGKHCGKSSSSSLSSCGFFVFNLEKLWLLVEKRHVSLTFLGAHFSGSTPKNPELQFQQQQQIEDEETYVAQQCKSQSELEETR